METKNSTRDDTEYESYSETCKVYDIRRNAIGLNYITDAIDEVRFFFFPRTRTIKTLTHKQIIRKTGRKREDLVLVDAGCGTGNYIANVSKFVGRAIGFEYNEGMLGKCREKCKMMKNVKVIEGNLLQPLPFEDHSVDVVIINQVLHHIAGSKKEENCFFVLKEFSRVLRDGGALVINTQDPKQHIEGFWWAEIIPTAVKKLADRLVTVEWLRKSLKSLSFNVDRVEIPPQPLMELKFYLDTNGPFQEQYRKGDSTWSLATEKELSDGLNWYRNTIVDQGKAEEYMKERENIRARVGQSTSIVAFLSL